MQPVVGVAQRLHWVEYLHTHIMLEQENTHSMIS